MKKETITKAVKVINRNIKFYQQKLINQLELKAELKFNNGNIKIASLDQYESNIQKYEIILAELATIKRAIMNNKISVKIFRTAGGRGCIYKETSDVLKKAGLDWDCDEISEEIWFLSIEEFEKECKEWAKKVPKMRAG